MFQHLNHGQDFHYQIYGGNDELAKPEFGVIYNPKKFDDFELMLEVNHVQLWSYIFHDSSNFYVI